LNHKSAWRVYGGREGEPIRMLGIQGADSEAEALRLFDQEVNSVSMLQAGLKPIILSHAVRHVDSTSQH